MKTNQLIGLAAILALIIFGAGIFSGYHLKRCPTYTETIKTDTVIQYISSSPITIASNPINTIIHDTVSKPISNVIYKTKYQLDTICPTMAGTFYANDTIRYDSLLIAISDTGNCNGIQARHTSFSGKIAKQVITRTITKNITNPPAMLSVYGGVSSLINTYNSQFNIIDAGPTLQLNIRNKYQVQYGYYINQKNHSFTFSTKLK